MLNDQIKTASSLPHSLYRAQQIKEFEGAAAELAGMTLYDLMKSAGQACYQVFKVRFPNAIKVLVFTGCGNNGGDGYIFAGMAKNAGLDVQLCQIGEPTHLSNEAQRAKKTWQQGQGKIENTAQANIAGADVIVDALLGTGLSGTMRPEFKSLIDKINQAGKPVLSVDIPSGLNADSGAVNAVAIKADATITFVGLKPGLLTGAAAEHCGQLYFSDLGISKQFGDLAVSDSTRVSYQDLTHLLKKRRRSSHKGQFGKTLVIGGNFGMPGAVRLAAESALRSGSGLVKVLTRFDNQSAVIAGRPELMLQNFSENTAQQDPFGDWPSTLVIGPGLGFDDWAQGLFDRVISSELNCVVDADALTLLARKAAYKDNWILTPHPGEAAKLLGVSIAEIEMDRFSAVRRLQAIYGGIVILKGAGTLICDGNKIFVANVGNPGMASGGMGDVLSGIIGGLLAQGLNSLDAARLAVCIHGDAADLAARQGERGLLASDLFSYIRKLVNPSC
ncbi:carbohydrate kinase, YjeF related protein [Psychromonas ingrahamii 37]|uniref:Bifunctional NAD(P)H-hydrate repair enzyme n=1 Tax=Psychromonas ingrahamii (strain DSM 17664 / CCUG 51855 / 37) TaxID=357804 RepID=A1SZL5_PSYIN|nr:bifunctional ADP-dependent NAD(P)H-hydrate dehydratase/NAD(P)H-hydrate epimerase [Psychromonas ingrahamii]ABM04930.1 carbohydrate kinase, YjeF related protein [Psychromonas ingrahamii 37]